MSLTKILKEDPDNIKKDPLTADETPEASLKPATIATADEGVYHLEKQRQKAENDHILLLDKQRKQSEDDHILLQNKKRQESENDEMAALLIAKVKSNQQVDLKTDGLVPSDMTFPVYKNLTKAEEIVDGVRKKTLDAKLNRPHAAQSVNIDDNAEDEVNVDGVSNDDLNAIIFRMEAVMNEIGSIREDSILLFTKTPVTNKEYQEGTALIQERMSYVIKALENIAQEVADDMPDNKATVKKLLNAKVHVETASEKLDVLAKLTAETLNNEVSRNQDSGKDVDLNDYAKDYSPEPASA